jgi:IS30 family transposase
MLLRQYFPKGINLATVTADELDRVADELNDRPRKRLGFYKPTERLAELPLH